eukprot:364986-Chlamydomonas_euryale.AAC.5
MSDCRSMLPPGTRPVMPAAASVAAASPPWYIAIGRYPARGSPDATSVEPPPRAGTGMSCADTARYAWLPSAPYRRNSSRAALRAFLPVRANERGVGCRVCCSSKRSNGR